MANIMKLEITDGMKRMIVELERMGAEVQPIVEKVMTQTAQRIQVDTVKAIADANLPRGGKYRREPSKTKASIVRDLQVRWEGLSAWIPIGFDFSVPGAGGYLITGTPKMAPDRELNRMYKQKRYMTQIQKDMENVLLDYLVKLGGQR